MSTYLVTCESGSHSDWSGWVDSVHDSEASALAAAEGVRAREQEEARRRATDDDYDWDWERTVADVVAVVACEPVGVRTVSAWHLPFGSSWWEPSGARWPSTTKVAP